MSYGGPHDEQCEDRVRWPEVFDVIDMKAAHVVHREADGDAGDER